jgi:hypothetical protein
LVNILKWPEDGILIPKHVAINRGTWNFKNLNTCVEGQINNQIIFVCELLQQTAIPDSKRNSQVSGKPSFLFCQ